MQREKSKQIRQFILEQIRRHPKNLVSLIEKRFNLTRQAVHRHLQKMIEEGLIIAEGSTRLRQYHLKPIIEKEKFIVISKDLKEDVLWRQEVLPVLGGIPKNVLDICHYGFTEMFNNVLDHSMAKHATISLCYTVVDIKIEIFDDGVGIFKKIQKELGLEDLRHAILELSKGKLTTDPKHHTGEGIFFSSRMFDNFSILSGALYFLHNERGDWLIGEIEEKQGTLVGMEIDISSPRTVKEVCDKFSSDSEDYGFTKTIVPVSLARYGDENLVSRSQAKRLLARFEKFKEIILDFEGVEIIGQAFADEIFRVFYQKNPNIHITFFRANEQVEKTIHRAIRGRSESNQ
ncbi:MAG: DUF4325 domain-containing protein [Deltaproteobacteria bacterium]|nr:DUF4325 domain-containing protein [Deltaproteobacteria bacterium]